VLVQLPSQASIMLPSPRKNNTPVKTGNLAFAHNSLSEFKKLVSEVSKSSGVQDYIVEKDYFISHILWCLVDCGFQVVVKGTVSLSKGFGFVHRISNEVSVTLDVNSTKGSKKISFIQGLKKARLKQNNSHRKKRKEIFSKLKDTLKKPLSGVSILLVKTKEEYKHFDDDFCEGYYTCTYQSVCSSSLLSPSIMLCVGIPSESEFGPKPATLQLSSFLHRQISSNSLPYTLNNPSLLCVHYSITLLETLALIEEGYSKPFEPQIATYYDDLASIIKNLPEESSSDPDWKQLVKQMFNAHAITQPIDLEKMHSSPCLALDDDESKAKSLKKSHGEIGLLYYHAIHQITLKQCVDIIQKWITKKSYL